MVNVLNIPQEVYPISIATHCYPVKSLDVLNIQNKLPSPVLNAVVLIRNFNFNVVVIIENSASYSQFQLTRNPTFVLDSNFSLLLLFLF